MYVEKARYATSLSECVTFLEEGLDDREREFIRNTPFPKFDLIFLLGFQNALNLQNKLSPLVRDFIKETGLFGDPDDVADAILRMLWCRVRYEDIVGAMQELTTKMKAHWNALAIDPETGKNRVLSSVVKHPLETRKETPTLEPQPAKLNKPMSSSSPEEPLVHSIEPAILVSDGNFIRVGDRIAYATKTYSGAPAIRTAKVYQIFKDDRGFGARLHVDIPGSRWTRKHTSRNFKRTVKIG